MTKLKKIEKYKSKFWYGIRKSRKNTILFILFVGLLVYFITVLIFACLYLETSGIGNSTMGVVTRFFDAFYFSFVSFVTIGFGDIAPINDCGKVILFVESICSVLFNGIFPSMLIYYAFKRPNSILFTTSAVITKNKDGKYLFRIRIGNRGEDLANCIVVLKVFTYTKEGIRKQLFLIKKPYAMLEHDTATTCSVELEKNEREKLLLKLQSLLKDNHERFVLRVNLTGTDVDTGETIALVKYYTEKDIKFGHNFSLVSNWTEDNESNPKWENFDETTISKTANIDDFYKLKVSTTTENKTKEKTTP